MNNLFIIYRFIHKMFACIVMVTFVPVRRYAGHHSTGGHPGFRSYWRWRSRRRGGRPTLPTEIRKLIREISIANPLWGAPRIHGELLKLGIDIGQTSVAKYMVKRRGPPSQGWKTFLHNH